MKIQSNIQWAAWICSAAVVTASLNHEVLAETHVFNFESDAVGADPADWFTYGTDSFQYVTNANPHAGAQAAYMTLYNNGMGFNLTNASIHELAVGSLDFYMAPNHQVIENVWGVQLFDGTNGTGTGGTVILLYPGYTDFRGSFNYGAGSFASGTAVNTNAYNHVQVAWDFRTATDKLTWIWNDSVTNISTTPGYDLAGVRSIQFSHGGAAPVGNDLFLDDVTVTAVPEPSALGLMSLAGMAAILHRSRRTR